MAVLSEDISLARTFDDIRALSEHYCQPLAIEDYGLQAIAETSPAKWHLAHTTWFFETFLLKPFVPGYQPANRAFEYLFNSYYNGIGAQFPRNQRGLLSRPTVEEVYEYRHRVSESMRQLLLNPGDAAAEVEARTRLGVQHEMQHQELFFTDLKYNLAINPLFPAYRPDAAPLAGANADTIGWQSVDGGLHVMGAESDDGFHFDNEFPRHQVFLQPFAMADRLISNGEVLDFIEAGGYQQPALWLADGWSQVQQVHWAAPLHWLKRDGEWYEFTLGGLRPVERGATACHLSGYEAEALARWLGARLPTEAEWEVWAADQPISGHFVDAEQFHPGPARKGTVFGDVWQWTRSSYAPYPGYQPAEGAIGEYNGKFMCNQWVLRGGSCVSDRRQISATYRNFFYPADRWQFSGVRLAKDGR